MKKLSEYTKQERYDLYVAAKEYFVKHTDENIGVDIGMCDAMDEIIGINYHENDSLFTIQDELPEMIKIKPGKEYHDSFYWWSLGDREIRVKMFDRIIEMTKPDESQ